jgi:hypothetical protein
MFATTLAAITPLQKVLGCKNPVPFGTPVVISFFQGYSLIHERTQPSCISASKISNRGQKEVGSTEFQCSVGLPG